MLQAHLEGLVKQIESNTITTLRHVKALEPQSYVGECNVMVIENFL